MATTEHAQVPESAHQQVWIKVNAPVDAMIRGVVERLNELRQVKNHVRMRAENLLKKHGGNYTFAPSQLMDTRKYPSHSQVIDWETAKNDILLDVEFMDSGNALWRLYWKLYCYLRMAVGDRQKVFESALVSLVV